MSSTAIQTPPLGGVEPLDKRGIAALLAEARERTLALIERVDEQEVDRVHDPLMSPLAWDLGHIAAFEDLWLGQQAGGLEPLRPELWEVYDATETPRPARGDLPYLRAREARAYMDAVRERSLRVLERADLSDPGDRLNSGGFVWDMVVRHEHQHNETMIQTLCLAERGVCTPDRRPLPRTAAAGPVRVRVEA
ncbi:MAG: DinB family protein, partial [Actinomycetota bacterium]|nr:DinB family protein [Actinomycetota bacterium]